MLEAALDIMRDLIINLTYEQHPSTNLTIAVRKALRELMENNALIINKADNGSCHCIDTILKHYNDVIMYH